MASEVHSITPQTNMNLINENIVYDLLSKDNYHMHGYANYGGDKNHVRYIKNTSNSSNFIKSAQRYKTLNSNHITNKNCDRRGSSKSCENLHNKNAHKGYESDESSATSYSSRDTSDNNGAKVNRSCNEKTADNNKNKIYARSNMFQPNLYQPYVNYNGGKYYSNCQIKRYPKNIDLTLRKAHGLMERFKSRVTKMRVNPNPPELLNGGPWDQLNQAIWDVFLHKVQKEDTYVRKLDLWKSIFLFIRKCLTNYGLYLVGSTMSGFGLESSDIDMCLLTKPLFINDPRIDSLHHLNHLKNLLLETGLATEAELIMAKVPILKFKNRESGFEIDLNCNNSVGIHNTHLLHCYAQLDWRVRPLVVIVKIWAQANHINDAKNMTISSYSWALMVIHYLQCGVCPPVLPCLHTLLPEKFMSNENHMDVQEDIEILKDFESNNTSCLGDLLIGFFHYYSYFNYSQYAISVRTGSRLPIETCKQAKSPKNDPHQWKCLCIEEPFDLSNTARSVFDLEIFKRIREIIMCSYKQLARNKALNHILPINLSRQR